MVLSTHVISVPEENLDICDELKRLSLETRLMMNIVSEVRGTPVYPVKPHNLWTLDDSTQYIFAGVSTLKEEARLTLTDFVRASGTGSLWVPDQGNTTRGMHVAMTCGFSGVGIIMPIVACVSGLSEHELPGTDFLDLQIPGFAGDAVVSGDSVGHVLFMRATEWAKQRKFRWYQKHVFIPGVNYNRMEYDELDVSTVSDIPPEDTAVVAIDGDIPQLKAMLDDMDMYEEHSIICNKISAASSAAEAAADRCPVFKGIKAELPHHTVRHLPPERCPMKHKVDKAFKSDKVGGLNLKQKDSEALIDFISVLPGVMDKVCTRDNIQSGFNKNGMLDPESRRYPSFNGMFSTCRANPTIESHMEIRSKIGALMKQYDEHGETDEAFLDQLSIRRDIGLNGEEILRNAEAMHLRRATTINDRALVEKRELLRQEMCSSKINKMNEANEEHRQKIKLHEAAVYQVLKSAEKEARLGSDISLSDEANLEYCTLDDFAVLKVPLLNALIFAHDDQVKRAKDIPRKGNMKEVVEQGAHNTISMAFKCRLKPNLLEGNLP